MSSRSVRTSQEKIERKHGVSFDEAEDAVLSSRRHVRRDRDGLYKVFSRTAAGRYLLVVLADRSNGEAEIVTAREMEPSERRLYQGVRGKR